jgi:hypothetical protein
VTRGYTAKPVWTWICDRCGAESGLAREQSKLLGIRAMRTLGWFIAELHGDLCPRCVAATADENGGE